MILITFDNSLLETRPDLGKNLMGGAKFSGGCIWRAQAAVILQQPGAGESFMI